MKNIQGKHVFESLEEVVDPKHTALLIIDMQNGLASPEGYTARQGDISISHQRSIIPALLNVLDSARSSGVRVVHVQVVFDENKASTSPASLYSGSRMRDFGAYWGHPASTTRKSNRKTLIDGTWEAEIIPELAPQPNEYIVKKHRNSAFVNTPMDQVLRSNGIQTVVLTGTTTAGCVLATALDALWYDYYTLVVANCIADCFPERHQAGMAILGERFDMPSSDEIVALWSKQRVDAAA